MARPEYVSLPHGSGLAGGGNDDEQLGTAVIKQAMDLWFTPEVTRRQALGLATRPFTWNAGQVPISPRGGDPVVRLNEEVRGIVRATANGRVWLARGDSTS